MQNRAAITKKAAGRDNTHFSTTKGNTPHPASRLLILKTKIKKQYRNYAQY